MLVSVYAPDGEQVYDAARITTIFSEVDFTPQECADILTMDIGHLYQVSGILFWRVW